MMSERGEILENLLAGGPLTSVDVVDCHVHLGPALYMQNPDTDADGLVRVLDSLGISMACVSHSVAMVSDWELGYHRPRGGMARLLTIVAERADFEYRVEETGEPTDPEPTWP